MSLEYSNDTKQAKLLKSKFIKKDDSITRKITARGRTKWGFTVVVDELTDQSYVIRPNTKKAEEERKKEEKRKEQESAESISGLKIVAWKFIYGTSRTRTSGRWR